MMVPWRRHRLLIAIAALFAASIGYGLTLDPIEASLRDSLRPPGMDFPLGTDHLGRDVLARIAHGFLLDFGLSLTIIAVSLASGLGLGMLAAEFAGPLDRALTFVMDVLTSLPQIVIALILAVHLGGGELSLIRFCRKFCFEPERGPVKTVFRRRWPRIVLSASEPD